jgi:hypothetical protein
MVMTATYQCTRVDAQPRTLDVVARTPLAICGTVRPGVRLQRRVLSDA